MSKKPTPQRYPGTELRHGSGSAGCRAYAAIGGAERSERTREQWTQRLVRLRGHRHWVRWVRQLSLELVAINDTRAPEPSSASIP
jgi:hypothetical protein